MITSFTCNQEKACSVAGFQGITQTGMYVGLITQCEISDKNAKGEPGATFVEIAFKANSWKTKDATGNTSEGTGEAMAFIRTYITNRNGERAFGHDIIDALMAVLKIDKMDAQPAKVFDRNYRNNKQVHDGYRIHALEKQIVGLLLQRENDGYTDSKGEYHESYRLNIITPFDAKTKQCAKEVLQGSEATIVESRFASLKDKNKAPQPPRSSGSAPVDAAPTEDDYPF